MHASPIKPILLLTNFGVDACVWRGWPWSPSSPDEALFYMPRRRAKARGRQMMPAPGSDSPLVRCSDSPSSMFLDFIPAPLTQITCIVICNDWLTAPPSLSARHVGRQMVDVGRYVGGWMNKLPVSSGNRAVCLDLESSAWPGPWKRRKRPPVPALKHWLSVGLAGWLAVSAVPK